MANISLTATCNRTCSFCFASDAMDGAPSSYMPLEQFEASLDFLERSGIPEARLLGGEPTIHPQFTDMVDRAQARGLRVAVFSGGLIPEKALRRLEAIPEPRLSVLLNVIDPGTGDAREVARQAEVMRRLGSRVLLGVTIDSPGVQLDFLLDLIAAHGLARSIRLGLGHPTLGGSNAHLHPRHYPEVGRRVTEFGLRAQSLGVAIDFDCGWVPCMFPPGALEALGKTSADVGLRCNPILDLLPDGQVISCYALSGHAAERLSPESDAGWFRQRLSERQQSDRHFMLFRECEGCEWRARGECTGGCLSASLGRLRQRAFEVTVPEVPVT
jgi:radical SAM protein with 4Fe4S-binding SPASM domain